MVFQMILLFVFLGIAFAVHLKAVFCAISIAKNRRIIAKDRFILSTFILAIHLLGLIVYYLGRPELREKEFKYFSDGFIDRIYGTRK